jgi:hypothetical protein
MILTTTPDINHTAIEGSMQPELNHADIAWVLV